MNKKYMAYNRWKSIIEGAKSKGKLSRFILQAKCDLALSDKDFDELELLAEAKKISLDLNKVVGV